MTTELDYRDLLAWWVRAYNVERDVPDRLALDPIAVPQYLASIVVWEDIDGTDCRCLLAGEALREFYRRSIRGERLSQVLAPRVRERYLAHYQDVMTRPLISVEVGTIYGGAEMYWINGFRVILPARDRRTGTRRAYTFSVRKAVENKTAADQTELHAADFRIPVGRRLDRAAVAADLFPCSAEDAVRPWLMGVG